MKKIIGYIKEYQSNHFDLKLYLSVALFVIVSFIFNYSFDFEDSVIDRNYGSFMHWVRMFLWMMMPFIVVTLLIKLFKKKVQLDRSFWYKVLFGFAILALGRVFNEHLDLLKPLPQIEERFLYKSINWVSKLFLVVLPLLMFYAIFEHEKPRNWYGLTFQKVDLKPYFVLLAGAIVLIALGSFLGDLQSYYPRYKFTMGGELAAQYGFPEWVSVLIFEICYGSSFVSVEVFFRGFLIYAFAKSLGGHAVLPMAVTYAYLHFGKPMSEAISSVFGGYLLGIISYYSRNVWGGIVIHMGVAWAMELFGYLQGLI